MSITSAVSNVSGFLKSATDFASKWFDPTRIRIARLEKKLEIKDKAIGAAEELLKIVRKQGMYANMAEHKRIDYERHYTKQWESWKDGQS